MDWPQDKQSLLNIGRKRIADFCNANSFSVPEVIVVPKSDWSYGVCAYYRPSYIKICPELCQSPCSENKSRNWTWPGSTTDREPYGVLAHELGHHVDWTVSERKGDYYGDFSIATRSKSGEKKISGYCPNDAEWFAEMFRVFVTNPDLLKHLRPITYGLFAEKWKPVTTNSWADELGGNVPDRVLRALGNKGAK